MKAIVNKNGLACSSPLQLSVQTDKDPVTMAALPHSDSRLATVATTRDRQNTLPSHF